MKKLTAFSLIFPIFSVIYAQIEPRAVGYYNDALIFAQNTMPMGTARTQALGGTGVTMGADLYSCILNPAGLGLAKRGQVTLGLGMNNFGASTDYISKTIEDSYSFLKLNHFGWISPLTTSTENSGNSLSSGSIAVSITRSNNYQKRFEYEGINTRSTMADRFSFLADGIHARVFENEAATGEIYDLASLAYATFVINPYVNDSTSYYTEFRDINDNLVAPIRQRESYRVRGGETMINISYGSSINDKFYWGAGFGIGSIRYKLSSIYEENLTRQATVNELQSFSLTNQRSVTGGGVNFNFGFIYRPVEMFRIGGSVQSPTAYLLTEIDDNEMTATFAGSSFQPATARMVQSQLDYNFVSPWRLNTGILVQFKKFGFFTAEAEWVTYGGMNLSTDVDVQGFSLDADNRTIKNLYKTALNLRAGLEGRTGIFRGRLGVAYFQDPYKIKLDDLNRNIMSYTGGIGIFSKNSAIDLAVTYTAYRSIYTPYTLPNPDFYYSAESKNSMLAILLGLTLFF
ncbi:hypothetical protein [Raineya orbicola]|jgi:hypothetical protein|uniref:Outer membrane protein transport protein (OMPP1/FadL/TodX) n=1 Tax=Raineya orbicola TaxID=2016530 RepID=A0A2N3IJK6_9BACT|nr:hypothetical protein [Raineya orbicola]PKQ70497.1 Outer membrane protein transport protein (OMPP1/FadL/TodX) [Raineya orbicola]